MTTHSVTRQIPLSFLLSVFVFYLPAQNKPSGENLLLRNYDLAPKHSKDTQYYVMESKLQKHALDGSLQALDVYRLYLRCVPKSYPEREEFTCLKVTFQVDKSAEMSIPSLANWTYSFTLTPNGRDMKGQMFGIDHAKFEQLFDEKGKPLPFENNYHVFNAFIDFHSMSVFAEKADSGNGVQHLKRVGQKIIHGASFSQPEVNLGSSVGTGSYFKNGQITLTFKGLGYVNKKTCALLEYDSGESSFYMIAKPFGNMEVKTKGSSHYFGDIYKDPNSGWIQKATLHELVISETDLPGAPNKINSVIERTITIDNVSKIIL